MLKRCRVLRIRNFRKIEVLEFISAAFAHGLLQGWIAVVGEELKRILLVIFLSHENQRCLRGQQKQRSRQHTRAARNERRKSFTAGPIANLVVVLYADHMRRSR